MAPNLLDETTIDAIGDQIDAAMTAEEERAEFQKFAPSGTPGDLSNGGMVNGATITPRQGGRSQTKGRAVARRAWMWDGTESLLPLAWNPEGTQHDGGRHYLLKRFCSCCKTGGFRGAVCPVCSKNGCQLCNGGRAAKVIAMFYLRKEDVPFPVKFYGSIPCFLPLCVRRGEIGFKTEEEMRIHARSRHRAEYQAYLDTLSAHRVDDVERLQRQVETLMMAQVRQVAAPVSPQAPVPEAAVVEKTVERVLVPKRPSGRQRRAASEAARAKAAQVSGSPSKSV